MYTGHNIIIADLNYPENIYTYWNLRKFSMSISCDAVIRNYLK